MKRINKTNHTIEWEALKGKDLNYRELWKRFGRTSSKDEKNRLREKLKYEQQGLCAYTEMDLDLPPYGYHIEHIRPRSLYPEDTFNYSNLVLSTLNNEALREIESTDYFGGHFKGSIFCEKLFVSCIDDVSDRFFFYRRFGEIEPHPSLNKEDRERAEYTIELLNLNSIVLRSMRRVWLDELDRCMEMCDPNQDSDFDELYEEHGKPNEEGIYTPFCTATYQHIYGIKT